MAARDDGFDWRRIVFGHEDLPDPDYPLDHVPKDERKGLISLSAVLLGLVFFAGTMWAGAEVSAAMGFQEMLSAMVVGHIILGGYVALLCAISAKAGLTTVLLARYSFGRVGAKWADLLLGGTQVGWFGVTIPMVAIPTATYFGLESAAMVSALILIWGLLHMMTAYFGYEGMEKLSYVAVPFLVLVGVLSIYLAIGDAGGIDGLLAQTGGGEMTFGLAVTIVVGTFISAGTQAPNWARFAINSRIAFWAGLIAFLVGNSFLFLSGAVGGAVYEVTPQGDLYEVLVAQGLATVGLIALILNIWTTNDNAAYAFSVAGAEAFEFDRKRPFVIAGCLIGIALALAGADALLLPWLELLGQYIPPLGAIIIADFLLCWRDGIPRMDDIQFTSVRWTGVIAYVVGCLVAVLTAGSIVPGVTVSAPIPGMAALNGMLAATAAHIVGYYALEKTGILSAHRIPEDADRVDSTR
ncbi:cytosine permease [Natronorubrum sp. JWXQ-INN-674]|uniref:Cytosine permease n=1 Tax=Natronorubrum halalkaliphilum TaxID=2691917 RepID=A0A6B0VN56_9EURY|nr:cytosine permease [Natronorubrum halalkaliphilum]MXV62625.1 cytosine permease [Natronorubrum halalkaliphilum]